MEEEFKRIYDCMRASETVADGEYFVIHADHLHDFKRAIEHYFDESKSIEKIGTFKTNKGTYIEYHAYDFVPIEEHPLNANEKVLLRKINEVIDKLNRTER